MESRVEKCAFLPDFFRFPPRSPKKRGRLLRTASAYVPINSNLFQHLPVGNRATLKDF